jgi:hypothetical protein
LTTKILLEINQDVNGSNLPDRQARSSSSIDSIINEAIKLEYETSFSQASQIHTPSRELNDMETMKIQELIDSNKALYAPVDEDLSNLVIGDCQIKVSWIYIFSSFFSKQNSS